MIKPCQVLVDSYDMRPITWESIPRDKVVEEVKKADLPKFGLDALVRDIERASGAIIVDFYNEEEKRALIKAINAVM